MAELERCPICGKAATVIHMVDTYYRADYGWDAGCAVAKDGDGIHTDLDLVRVVGMPSKEAAVVAWNIKANKVRATMAETYLSKDEVTKTLIEFFRCSHISETFIKAVVDRIPPADVVEVVRCRDCIYKDTCEYLCSHCENWFCGDGKRRADNDRDED